LFQFPNKVQIAMHDAKGICVYIYMCVRARVRAALLYGHLFDREVVYPTYWSFMYDEFLMVH